MSPASSIAGLSGASSFNTSHRGAWIYLEYDEVPTDSGSGSSLREEDSGEARQEKEPNSRQDQPIEVKKSHSLFQEMEPKLSPCSATSTASEHPPSNYNMVYNTMMGYFKFGTSEGCSSRPRQLRQWRWMRDHVKEEGGLSRKRSGTSVMGLDLAAVQLVRRLRRRL
uniref:Probable protein S-acyltransferase 22 n=1 Tax=Tanacetum cinerariifolium TaxID=118510 RepID=A0A6L2LQL1_TANCI|nr:probable protein S-acyltransferase 22 [Tanacetum cinerariifolium]